jgi:hypothetical protein
MTNQRSDQGNRLVSAGGESGGRKKSSELLKSSKKVLQSKAALNEIDRTAKQDGEAGLQLFKN